MLSFITVEAECHRILMFDDDVMIHKGFHLLGLRCFKLIY